MCYVTIFDGSGKPITVEVSREIYQVFADYEREMERQRKEEYRHRDARSWDTCLIFELSTEPLEQTYERMRTLREIQEALLSFTPKQRRRFLLHFAYGYYSLLAMALRCFLACLFSKHSKMQIRISNATKATQTII